MPYHPIRQLVTMLMILLMSASAQGQAIPDEARRHMTRGEAAVEMAKSPEEFGQAIKEFQLAADQAPTWPDPYYNLGLVQEKAGKLKEAIKSLNRYLQLAPEATDAASVKQHIYKLEYKAEQVLSVPDIIDALVSFMGWDTNNYAQSPRTSCRLSWLELVLLRESTDSVKALSAQLYFPDRQNYQTLKVTEPVLKYVTTVNVCDAAANKSENNCDSVIENEIEVVSKRLVKVTQKVLRGGSGAGVAGGDNRWCSFTKK